MRGPEKLEMVRQAAAQKAVAPAASSMAFWIRIAAYWAKRAIEAEQGWAQLRQEELIG